LTEKLNVVSVTEIKVIAGLHCGPKVLALPFAGVTKDRKDEALFQLLSILGAD
jgi:hypothetical protein